MSMPLRFRITSLHYAYRGDVGPTSKRCVNSDRTADSGTHAFVPLALHTYFRNTLNELIFATCHKPNTFEPTSCYIALMINDQQNQEQIEVMSIQHRLALAFRHAEYFVHRLRHWPIFGCTSAGLQPAHADIGIQPISHSGSVRPTSNQRHVKGNKCRYLRLLS